MNNKTMAACAVAAWAAFANAAVPTVALTRAEQNQSSHRVTVEYTLDAPGIVTFDVLTNGVSIGDENIQYVTGDANKVVGAGAHTLYWAPTKSWEGHQFGGNVVRFKLTAWATNSPPDYMALNMLNWSVRYYTSTNALPGGLGDMAYKTDVLLMRRIPAGGQTFVEGSPATESYRSADRETPRNVSFSDDYYIGVFEFTYAQFARIGWKYKWSDYNAVNYSSRSENGDICPINSVSFGALRGTTNGTQWPTVEAIDDDSVIGYLRSKSGIDFDLPTDAQWEFSCRAGTVGMLYNNATLTWDKADEIGWLYYPEAKRVTAPQEVGQKKPNAYGLYDMIGNVKELTRGRFYDSGNRKPGADVIDPKGIAGGSYWNCRGSSYSETAADPCRAAALTPAYNNGGSSQYGFRLVCPVGLKIAGVAQ